MAKDNKALAEKIFGGVSDFHGAWGAGEKKQATEVPAQTEERVPHWHDSCFTGRENPEDTGCPVKEAELCSHF